MLCQHFCSFCFSNVENVSGRERYRPLPSLYRNTASLLGIIYEFAGQPKQQKGFKSLRLQPKLVENFLF